MSTPVRPGPSEHGPVLTFEDVASLSDLGRYAYRAKMLDDEAAIRLQASGRVLAAWVGVLPGSGILGEGLVLGLRTFALAEPADLDIAVPAAAVTDRTARTTGQATFSMPDVHLTPTWASLTPPRSGWEYAGAASGDDLAAVARTGLADIGAAVKERGAAAGFTKQQVWGATVTYDPVDEGSGSGGIELAAGVAFGAYALGFLGPGQPVQVYRTNRWVRVTGPGGHVLAR